jgi:hypothetical protein
MRRLGKSQPVRLALGGDRRIQARGLAGSRRFWGDWLYAHGGGSPLGGVMLVIKQIDGSAMNVQDVPMQRFLEFIHGISVYICNWLSVKRC